MSTWPQPVDDNDIELVDAAARWIATRLAFGGVTYDSDPYAWNLARCLGALTDRWMHSGDTQAWVEQIIPTAHDV